MVVVTVHAHVVLFVPLQVPRQLPQLLPDAARIPRQPVPVGTKALSREQRLDLRLRASCFRGEDPKRDMDTAAPAGP